MAVKLEDISIEGVSFPVYSLNTLIVGSGAAGLNAALRLFENGREDIAVVTDQWGGGASFNAGSDKQTYYKLSLAGSEPDSPRLMAKDLFDGGCMHGDIALCEAQHSAEAFFRLVHLGVPFPHDRYGGYAGYRTDNDRRGRATSAGPLTSRVMCECLGREVCEKGFPILDDHAVIALLTESPRKGGRRGREGRRVVGAVAIDRSRINGDNLGLVLFNARNVILATGGPGGMYAASVYPKSQSGSTGLGLAAGAVAQNLTESQFGLASKGFRWNLSGSYQQAIPRYISTGPGGGDAQDFLNEFFGDMRTLAGAIFRKGYEWPFDAAKIAGFGSSLIDLLVYRETVERGRRIFLDFTQNPARAFSLEAFSLDLLDEEARAYLDRSGALLPTPIERLSAMNPQAVELFRKNGIDLAKDRLEIALCAQHSNGGLKGNIWWESNVRRLFPIGEVCGTHGVRRPGGAALNAGQVGGTRAALFIAARYGEAPRPVEDFAVRAGGQVRQCLEFARRAVSGEGGEAEEEEGGAGSSSGPVSPDQAMAEIRERMSASAAAVREPAAVARAREEAWRLFEILKARAAVESPEELPEAFRAVDLCLTHAVYLEAVAEYLAKGGASRGSAVVLDKEGAAPCPGLDGKWRFRLAEPGDFVSKKILEIGLDDAFKVAKRWVDIRPVPPDDGWFETVWRDFIEDRIFMEED